MVYIRTWNLDKDGKDIVILITHPHFINVDYAGLTNAQVEAVKAYRYAVILFKNDIVESVTVGDSLNGLKPVMTQLIKTHSRTRVQNPRGQLFSVSKIKTRRKKGNKLGVKMSEMKHRERLSRVKAVNPHQ